MQRFLMALLLLLSPLLVVPDALGANARQRMKLEESQNGFASAIRWGDYESAWAQVEPKHRDEHPMTALEVERYQQLQVSSYREGGNSTLKDGTVVRDVEIGVINRHTLAERRVRWREQWRWDPEAKRWWAAGLPDFWEGQ